jgi:uncharacterized protein YqeY
VLLTLVRNYLAVSLTPEKLDKTAKLSLTCVAETSEKSLTSVSDASNACFAGDVDTGEAPK